MNPFRLEAERSGLLFGSKSSRPLADLHGTALGRRIVYSACIALASIFTGAAVVYADPLLVVGMILSGIFVITVMRWPFLGLMVYLFVFMLRIGEVYPALAPLRLERVVGALTLASLVFQQVQRYGRIAFDGSKQTRLLLLVILAAFVSLPFAYWRFAATNGVISFVKLLIFYILVVQLIDTREKLRAFVVVYCVLIAYLAFLSVRDYFAGSLLFAQGIERAVGATSAGGGPNEMGATMACTIPLLLLLGLQKRLLKWRTLLFTGAGLLLITLVLTGSRSGLLGFIAALCYLWLQSKRKIVFGIIGIILLPIGFIAMPEQYQDRYGSITHSEIDGSSQARLDVWKKGLRMLADRPLTGVGIDCFGTANAISYSSGRRRSYLESHSLYVQVPAEMGLFGAFAFFWFVIEFLRLNRKVSHAITRDPDADDWQFERALLNGIFTGFIALLTTGVFGHSLMRPTWYLYAALGLVTWRLYLDHVENRNATTPQLPATAIDSGNPGGP